MTKSTFLSALLGALFVAGLAIAPAHAQATRTWISGVGDDANPCTRTAPCATFAGAFAQTAAGGEIAVLDPGDFGPLTIDRALTVDGRALGELAGIQLDGGSAITIAAGPGDAVVLRGLTLDGSGTA